ncbi:ABC transporter ATP-binding protein [Alicyclobacillus acidiphilus]|uniref:ABC transporter ATP-binding protein n=1 Tax=Alicyclobacillus acidiphilus TaxID=182455 RepID=UPI00082D106E|nr:ABC transporter ATP-binding protein [Alicyclobacillus acidiphilus]
MSAAYLLDVGNVSKVFRLQKRTVRAVHRASLRVREGESVGIVGESGSGKSTLGRCAVGLLRPDEGAVRFLGTDLTRLSNKQMRAQRRHMQVVFQNPSTALNQRMTVGRNILDPLLIHRVGTRMQRGVRVFELMEQVGLSPEYANAFPFELSGGQQQRVMIARALALDPKLLLCDEVLSALDVSVQAQILALLLDLRRDRGLSMLFISHNLPAVEVLSDVIAVMYLGEILEMGRTEDLLANPRHPYTRVLFDSVLDIPESKAARKALRPLPGEMPSPYEIPNGCVFHTRCPVAQDVCRREVPQARTLDDDRQVACHYV